MWHVGLTSVGGGKRDCKWCAWVDIHQKVGVVSHAQVDTAIAETASRRGVRHDHDDMDTCTIAKESTNPWVSHNMDKAILESCWFRGLSLDFVGPRIVLESEITDVALWYGAGAK